MALKGLCTSEGVGEVTYILTQFHTGGSPTPGPTPYLFIYHFWHKRYPFRILVIEKWYPCHILLCNATWPLNAVYKAPSAYSFYSHKLRLSALMLQLVKSLPFPIIPELSKRYPFLAEPSNLVTRAFPLKNGWHHPFFEGKALGTRLGAFPYSLLYGVFPPPLGLHTK